MGFLFLPIGMGTFLQTLLLKLILSVTTQKAVFKPFLSAFMEIMKNLEQTVEEKKPGETLPTSQLSCFSIFL